MVWSNACEGQSHSGPDWQRMYSACSWRRQRAQSSPWWKERTQSPTGDWEGRDWSQDTWNRRREPCVKIRLFQEWKGKTNSASFCLDLKVRQEHNRAFIVRRTVTSRHQPRWALLVVREEQHIHLPRSREVLRRKRRMKNSRVTRKYIRKRQDRRCRKSERSFRVETSTKITAYENYNWKDKQRRLKRKSYIR